jgi:DNA-binding winged helix-turn-helix (wHTH) protein
MSQHNLATIDRTSPRSNPPARYAGHSPREERRRMYVAAERVSEDSRRPSGDPPRAAVTGLRPFPSETTTADLTAALAVPTMSFGPFHVLPKQRLLLEGDRPVRLGSRALDILVALVERAGELVSKSELMARVWPGIVVEDSNLKVQIAALRHALRDGEKGGRYISTVAGRGYWFVAPVVQSAGIDAGACNCEIRP